MPYYSTKRIGERLNVARELINIVETDPVISERMSEFNYVAERLVVGRQLVDKAAQLDRDQRARLGQQTAASRTLEELVRGVRQTFSSDRKITRTLLRDNARLFKELRLGIKMERKNEVFLQQARHFYEQVFAHDEVTTLFQTQYNITPEVFDNRVRDLDAMEEAMLVKQVRIGETKTTLRLRNEAMKELDVWMKGVIGVARYLFKDETDLLVQLGVGVKTKTKKAKKAETTEGSEGETAAEGGAAQEGDTASEGSGAVEQVVS